MGEKTPGDRLQPSLLDRLIDDEPGKLAESRERRVMSSSQFRKAVLRDLSWLLNTGARATFENIEQWPEVAESVINFGMPDLCGMTTSSISTEEIERLIRKTILMFEPRILKQGLTVRVMHGAPVGGHSRLTLEIAGEIWGQPLPDQLYLRTEIDLDTGECAIVEGDRG